MDLPTAREINPIPEDLDGQWAERSFLGKTLEQAETMFRESSMTYHEDLMFMGPKAFRFYVQAAINYIRSEAAKGDSDIINGFAGTLEIRLTFEASEVLLIAPQLASACAYIVDYYDRFLGSPEIYGDLRSRFRDLHQRFLRHIHS